MVTSEIKCFPRMSDGRTGRRLFFRLRSGPESVGGQVDSRSHPLCLTISPIPIPPLRWPLNQNKIVITTGRKLCLSIDGRLTCVIASDLGFDRLTSGSLVLQEESMVAGHILINRLPQLFLLPAL